MSQIDPIRIVAFAGSARRDSLNKKLARVAATGAVVAGADASFIDLNDFPLPLYDGDGESENGLPKSVAALRPMFQEADGFLIASPEYNGFLSPMLKNTLDWLSRSEEASPDLSAFQGKVAAIMSASPGPLGGLRGLRGLRELLTNLGVTILPREITIRAAYKAFDDDGTLLEARQAEGVELLASELVALAGRLKP